MLKVGIVGARGMSTVMGFGENPDSEVTAVCDLDEGVSRSLADRLGVRPYRVFEDMLGADIDAVVIATPMQCHVPQALKALEAGKHVMSEVTAGVTVDELWWLKEAVEGSGRVYFFAENYCYIPENQMVRSMVAQGAFGEVYYAEGEYLHDIRSLAKYPDGRDSWRRHWQLERRGNFYPTHSLGPIMQWFGDDRVAEVSCFGTGPVMIPGRRGDDTSVTVCRTAKGRLIRLRLDCVSDRPHNMAYYSLQGTEGAYESERGFGDAKKVWIRDGREGGAFWEPLDKYRDRFMPERYLRPEERHAKAGHGGGDFYIVDDFVDACLGRSRPAIDVYDGIEWTCVALLSQASAEAGGKAMAMPDFRG
ncbi:MAG: Gfo/Idh/MocA family oxidoreductase [Oscillospiraceae bacterium]|nr:Gfo/Idh/MocA family oxidoreductase [Oscillospiraceae bacterium]